MKRTIITIVVTLVVLGALSVAYIFSGIFNVSQLVPHKAVTKWVIRTTLHYSVQKRFEKITVPAFTDTSMIAEGFTHYNEMCVICHGAPGIEPGELVQGLYPRPPVFYKSDDMPETGEAFWIIKNGIKMTGMPAFGPTHTDQQIWAITDFLLNKLNKMSPEEYLAWRKKYPVMGTDMDR